MSAASGLIGLTAAATLAGFVALGALPYALGALAVAAYAGAVTTLRETNP